MIVASAAASEPRDIKLHPTAREIGVAQDEILEIKSSEGSIKAPVYISERVARGAIAVPLGQGHTSFGRYARGIGANAFAALKPGSLAISVTASPSHESRRLVSPIGKSD